MNDWVGEQMETWSPGLIEIPSEPEDTSVEVPELLEEGRAQIYGRETNQHEIAAKEVAVRRTNVVGTTAGAFVLDNTRGGLAVGGVSDMDGLQKQYWVSTRVRESDTGGKLTWPQNFPPP